MELRLSRLYLAFIALCGCLMLGSCRDNSLADEPENPDGPQLNDGPVVMLHISAINAGSRTSAVGPAERIKSLRIIMIHEGEGGEKRLEANRLIDAHDTASEDYVYIFQKRTAVGTKKFYLIANEESVKSVQFVEEASSETPEEPDEPDDPAIGGGDTEPGDTEPETPATSDAQMTLTQFLNLYEPDMVMNDFGAGYTTPENDTDGTYAKEFEKKLNSLYFAPLEGSYEIEDGKVYLPYSAYYTYEIEEDGGHEVDKTGEPMYLVPVATKFNFKFINYRTNTTVVDYLTIQSANKTNYLMAQLDDEELMKKFDVDNSYYWINWLKYVADKVNETADNTENNASMNGNYGWISKYYMPKDDDTEYDFVSESWFNDAGTYPKAWRLSPGENDDTPSETQSYGPYYLPEGHHMEIDKIPEKPEGVEDEDDDDDDGDGTDTDTDTTSDPDQSTESDPKQDEPAELVEKYNLTIQMHDDSEGATVKTASTEISYLKSLFRNTNVVITITLREGGVKIYAETQPWAKKEAYGYVQDKDDIK